MRATSITSITAILSAFLTVSATGAGSGAKGQYTLFNPTPVAQMREFNTDRPDATESAYTVDAGHFQFETDLVNYTKDQDKDGTTTKTLAVNHINLKAGLLNNLDLQLIIQSYTEQETTDSAGVSEKIKGLGDVLLRVKYNLLGNDGGPVAFALMPYVKLPTNGAGLGNSSVEGGLIFATAIGLQSDFSMGTMFQFDAVRNATLDGYHTEFTSSLTIGIPILGKLGGYTELFSKASGLSGDGWVATFDTGLTYEFIPKWQVDTGANIGLTETASDLKIFVGLSARF